MENIKILFSNENIEHLEELDIWQSFKWKENWKIRHRIIIVYMQLFLCTCFHVGKSETEKIFEHRREREDATVSYDYQFKLIKQLVLIKLELFSQSLRKLH